MKAIVANVSADLTRARLVDCPPSAILRVAGDLAAALGREFPKHHFEWAGDDSQVIVRCRIEIGGERAVFEARCFADGYIAGTIAGWRKR